MRKILSGLQKVCASSAVPWSFHLFFIWCRAMFVESFYFSASRWNSCCCWKGGWWNQWEWNTQWMWWKQERLKGSVELLFWVATSDFFFLLKRPRSPHTFELESMVIWHSKLHFSWSSINNNMMIRRSRIIMVKKAELLLYHSVFAGLRSTAQQVPKSIILLLPHE